MTKMAKTTVCKKGFKTTERWIKDEEQEWNNYGGEEDEEEDDREDNEDYAG